MPAESCPRRCAVTPLPQGPAISGNSGKTTCISLILLVRIHYFLPSVFLELGEHFPDEYAFLKPVMELLLEYGERGAHKRFYKKLKTVERGVGKRAYSLSHYRHPTNESPTPKPT